MVDYWPALLRELNATEQGWKQYDVAYPREDAVHWMPYAIPSFVALLADAVMSCAPGPMVAGQYTLPRFLDVGCGPGTKCRLARAMFGLPVYGIDIVPRFVAEAQAHEVPAEVADAFTWPGYGAAEIVLVNRPSTDMDTLEPLIMEAMSPGAALMAVNWAHDPSRSGWVLIAQEDVGHGPVRGVWVKP